MTSITSGMIDYQRSYEISPIILVGGVAGDLPGNVLPIVSITEAANYSGGVTGNSDGGSAPSSVNQDGSQSPVSSNNGTSLSSSGLGRFIPLPGATVIDNQVGQYPFANQSVAANAIITQPLSISLLLICPVNSVGGYQARLAVFSNLQSLLTKHINAGGTFNIATPSFLYTDCLLIKLQDVSDGDTHQVQTKWRFDFTQPLLTLAEAQKAMNLLMNKLDAGTAVEGDPPSASGGTVGVGSSATLQGPSVVPAAQPLAGAAGSGHR